MSEVSFPNASDTIRGWLEMPADAPPYPALVLIPDVRGLYEHFRDVARRFAAAGFATLALDPYSREGTPDLPDMEAVFRWMKALPDARVVSDVRAAVAYLTSRGDVRRDRIGVTGYCMGGQYALMSACSVPGLAACVSWYGMLRLGAKSPLKPEYPLEMAARLSCPVLGLYGARDTLIPTRDVEELRRVFSEGRKEFEIVCYPNAGHAFFNDSRQDMYVPDAARDAWSKALAFLRRHLDAS